MPLISVIIPVFNHAVELEKTLENIFKQTLFQELEIVVVDDGSKQSQVSYIQKNLIARHPSVKFIFAEHSGASAARNRGFKETHGDYVIFWDADILGKPDMLEKMLKAFKFNLNASYAYSSFNFGWKEFSCGPFDASKLKKVNFITTTSLIRRIDFPDFDESLGKFQDWDLWLTMLDHNKIGVWVPEFLFIIKPRSKGLSSWLPSFVYKFFWLPIPALRKYMYWKKIVQDKHHIKV